MPIAAPHERGEALYAYTAKQDLEARVFQVEHDETGRWGGVIAFEGGYCYYVSPQPGRPVFPIGLRVIRSTLL